MKHFFGGFRYFNPRSRTGSDQQHQSSWHTNTEFQSTLPHGERRFMLNGVNEFLISIHAPARGATECKTLGDYDKIISIHAPARGATRTQE